jgi:GntR family transcriptional regulator
MSEATTWTSVSLPYLTGEQPDPWGNEAAAHGGRGSQTLGEVTEIDPPPAVAAMLQLAAGARVVVRRRTMFLDDRPVELTDSYYPADIACGTSLAEPRKIRGGAVGVLIGLGLTPCHISEDVHARLATPDEREALQLEDPACVQLLARTVASEDHRRVEASMMTMLAGRRLRYQLTI